MLTGQDWLPTVPRILCTGADANRAHWLPGLAAVPSPLGQAGGGAPARTGRGVPTCRVALVDGPVVHLERGVAPAAREAHHVVLAVAHRRVGLLDGDVVRAHVEDHPDRALVLGARDTSGGVGGQDTWVPSWLWEERGGLEGESRGRAGSPDTCVPSSTGRGVGAGGGEPGGREPGHPGSLQPGGEWELGGSLAHLGSPQLWEESKGRGGASGGAGSLGPLQLWQASGGGVGAGEAAEQCPRQWLAGRGACADRLVGR